MQWYVCDFLSMINRNDLLEIICCQLTIKETIFSLRRARILLCVFTSDGNYFHGKHPVGRASFVFSFTSSC